MTSLKLSFLRALFAYFGRCGFRMRRHWARVLGWLAPRLLRSRARIVRTNLALAFPQHSAHDREAWLRRHFDLRPRAIIEMLDLLRPIYSKTAVYGHFGREEPEFTWEMLDKAEALRSDAGL